MTPSRIIRSSAPVRLDFAGGWTDVAPFATEVGGVVVNAAIELRTRVEIIPGGDRYQLHSEDFGAPMEESVQVWSKDDSAGADLRKAALRRSGIGPCRLHTRSEVPAGSGLGGSGALGVALVAAMDAAQGLVREPIACAEEAFCLEAIDAALPGGRQDQYAAALGGFHQLHFGESGVLVDRIELESGFATALMDHLVLCYTGTSRVSSNTIARVMGGYAAGSTQVVGALHALVEIAQRMAEALDSGDLAAVASLVTRNWHHQQQLDPGMQTPEMATLERTMIGAGAIGGKAAGAGAGGSMFFVVRNKGAAVRAAREAGSQVIPFTWATRGIILESP